MKFIFKYDYELVPARHPGLFGEVKYVPICTGGNFIAENGKDEIKLTPYSIITKYKDWTNACINDLRLFFGSANSISAIDMQSIKDLTPLQVEQSTKFSVENSNAYIGKWNEDLEKEANIYYIVIDNFIHKLFICKNEIMGFTDVTGKLFVIEFNGYMLYSNPDDGDEIYDNLKEAEKQIKKHDLRRV